MKRFSSLLCACVVGALVAPMPTAAEELSPLNPLIISEIKIKNDTAGHDEYIELRNISGGPVDLRDYQLGYFNSVTPAVTQMPVKAVLPMGLLPAGDAIVLAKQPDAITDSVQSPFGSLSDTGGLLQLLKGEEIVDSINWTSTGALAVEPVQFLPGSASAKSFGRLIDEMHQFGQPAVWSLVSPAPDSRPLLGITVPIIEPEPEAEAPTEEVDPPISFPEPEVPLAPEVPAPPTDVPPEETLPPIVLPLRLSELLPNPASPQTDSSDEYVELFNPNNEPVDLAGYSIETGTNFSYRYVFSALTLEPNGYLIVTSGDSNLSLANTAGNARLLSPSGEILDTITAYSDAPDGQAWALINGTWQWTITPTVAAANMLAIPIVPVKPTTLPKAATKKTAPKVTAAKNSAPKAAKTSAPKVAAAKTSKAATVNMPEANDAVAEVPPPVHPLVLGFVTTGALLYAGYEYRQDMANRLHQFRAYRAARRAAR